VQVLVVVGNLRQAGDIARRSLRTVRPHAMSVIWGDDLLHKLAMHSCIACEVRWKEEWCTGFSFCDGKLSWLFPFFRAFILLCEDMLAFLIDRLLCFAIEGKART